MTNQTAIARETELGQTMILVTIEILTLQGINGYLAKAPINRKVVNDCISICITIVVGQTS